MHKPTKQLSWSHKSSASQFCLGDVLIMNFYKNFFFPKPRKDSLACHQIVQKCLWLSANDYNRLWALWRCKLGFICLLMPSIEKALGRSYLIFAKWMARWLNTFISEGTSETAWLTIMGRVKFKRAENWN